MTNHEFKMHLARNESTLPQCLPLLSDSHHFIMNFSYKLELKNEDIEAVKQSTKSAGYVV